MLDGGEEGTYAFWFGRKSRERRKKGREAAVLERQEQWEKGKRGERERGKESDREPCPPRRAEVVREQAGRWASDNAET